MAFFKRQKYVRSSITVDICTRIRQATKIGDIQLEDLSLSLSREVYGPYNQSNVFTAC